MWQQTNYGPIFIRYLDGGNKMAFVDVNDISFVDHPNNVTRIHLKDGTVLSSADSVETIFKRIGE